MWVDRAHNYHHHHHHHQYHHQQQATTTILSTPPHTKPKPKTQHGQPGADLHTPKGGKGGSAGVLANIKAAFGQALGRELLEFECAYAPAPPGAEAEAEGKAGVGEGKGEGGAGRPDKGEGEEGEGDGEGEFRFKARGFVSNANYHVKKGIFMLFINNRLVGRPPAPRPVCPTLFCVSCVGCMHASSLPLLPGLDSHTCRSTPHPPFHVLPPTYYISSSSTRHHTAITPPPSFTTHRWSPPPSAAPSRASTRPCCPPGRTPSCTSAWSSRPRTSTSTSTPPSARCVPCLRAWACACCRCGVVGAGL